MREPSFRVRAAQPDDLPALEAVEHSAAGLFRAVGLGWIVDSPTAPMEALARNCAEGPLGVGAGADDRPAGFLAAAALDGALYIDEPRRACATSSPATPGTARTRPAAAP